MNINGIEFEQMNRDYGVKKWEAAKTVTIDGEEMTVQFIMTQYAGDEEHPAYFSVDIRSNGMTFHGDEYSDMTEALDATTKSVTELYEDGLIGPELPEVIDIEEYFDDYHEVI